MREIKFRGKLINSGKWSEGNLIIRKENNAEIMACTSPDATPIGIYGRIDVNTIGQFIGLKDKNGKEIYEGDIVSKETFDDTKPNYRNVSYAKVIYIEELAGFYLVNKDNKILWNVADDKYNIEVASTIYDNPELLEV